MHCLMMALRSKLFNFSHEDAFTINKDKGFLVDQRMIRKMAMGKEDDKKGTEEVGATGTDEGTILRGTCKRWSLIDQRLN